MCKLIAYVTLVKKEKVFVLLNEMTVDEMRYALLTTVINNPEFQELHGIQISKIEKEITLGLYKDTNGNLIYRNRYKDGSFSESVNEYKQRIISNSPEHRNIRKIATWIESETEGLIFTKDISGAYDDKTLEFEIRKASITKGIHYFFYDTLKQDTAVMGDWAALKATATKLSELTKQLDIFIYSSIQLTDDANTIDPESLNSSLIANAKQIKHVLHTLILFKEINKRKLNKYQYLATNSDWGDPSLHDLDENKRYGIAVIDKNRFGDKKKLVFEFDLNRNVWIEQGEMYSK